MDLEGQLSERRREIATDAYSMSIGELANLYENGELEIHPEFQRVYRWDNTQKSRLIESILLGIPLPSIFVAQRDDGVWDVVDGVQRLSTIFHFMGDLKDEQEQPVAPLTLEATKQLPGLVDVAYAPQGGGEALSTAQRLDFKRAKVDIKIIKRESDVRAKFDLFQRLNTYGSPLTRQEARNCMLVSTSMSELSTGSPTWRTLRPSLKC